MSLKIKKAKKTDFDTCINIWERSVHETHTFLSKQDILMLKPLILHTYFDSVNLFVGKIKKDIVGFLGFSNDEIEMLFLDPNHFRKGYGKEFLRFAINEHQMKKVSVNEQNPIALKFYQNSGFQIFSQDEIDAQGKPFPILHLELQ